MLNLLKIYYFLINKRIYFYVHYKSLLNGNTGYIGYYGKSKKDVREKFTKEFPNSQILEIHNKR